MPVDWSVDLTCGNGVRANLVSFLLSVERNQAYFYCLFKGN